ncbi:DNA glycosylase [Trametes elegans]|nr:DNA glycosylase [Trametes elegans]
MAVTRSATRSTTAAASSSTDASVEAAQSVAQATSTAGTKKRKTADSPAEPVQKKARATKAKSAKQSVPPSQSNAAPISGSSAAPAPGTSADGEELVPAVLTFSFEEAKQHLIRVDSRFEDVFRRVKCKPYEHLERVDPFRYAPREVCLGQQISWKAAASITHKFVRLFDPSIPESVAESRSTFFPSAHQVVTKDVATLRTAGLSARKAEYILDLAARFADGRLSTRKLLQADDEELHTMLTEVRGIGRNDPLADVASAVDMFAMFSLRRPDILPVGKFDCGDLGVQRGVLRWFTSLHSPSNPISLREDKLSDQDQGEPVASNRPPSTGAEGAGGPMTVPRAATPDASSIAPAPDSLLVPGTAVKGKEKTADEGATMGLPKLFTPSINKTLNMQTTSGEDEGELQPPPLPEGLTVAVLKSRLSGKKVKGALLTPKEMEDLTECWRPYRSLGVYYMWALAEEPK